jgi:hypothetical protein
MLARIEEKMMEPQRREERKEERKNKSLSWRTWRLGGLGLFDQEISWKT